MIESAAPPGARLTARRPTTRTTLAAGRHALGLGSGRDAILLVPERAREGSVPLIVLLHGAGGSGEGILDHLAAALDASGAAILAPDSRASTWDAIRALQRNLIDVVQSREERSGFGADVVFLDRALERVNESVAVDPARVTVAGFSDGATYALSLGLINGDLFPRIVAFSPGFVIQGEPHGRPHVFVSHGRTDRVLPIDRCSRRIVPDLERRGYTVTYREFDGGHGVPADIARDALAWAGAATPQT
jgi:phospholipase/carboxylesterase